MVDAALSLNETADVKYFPPEHVLLEEGGCEFYNHAGGGTIPYSNFFLASEGATNAYITFDLGTSVFMNNIQIKNTNNRGHNK